MRDFPKNKIKKEVVFFFFLIIFIFNLFYSTLPAQAIQTEIEWPRVPGVEKEFKDFTLPDLVRYFFNFAISIGGLAAFFMLVFGGFRYLTSTGNEAVLRDAKDILISAILGLLLLLASYLLLQAINPDILILKPLGI